MSRSRKHSGLRTAVPRWPSTDHRDFQTVGALTAWPMRRRMRMATRTPAEANRSRGSRPPVLSEVAGVHRDGAALHVQLLARRAALDERPPILTPAVGRSSSPGATRDPDPVCADQGRTWTVTLPLN